MNVEDIYPYNIRERKQPYLCKCRLKQLVKFTRSYYIYSTGFLAFTIGLHSKLCKCVDFYFIIDVTRNNKI